MYYPPQQPMRDFGLLSQQPPIPIVVYFRRSRMLFYVLIFVGLLALLGTLFWFLSHPDPLPVAFYACVGIVLPYLLSFMASIFRVLVLHQPALVITSAGIQILALSVGSYSINWPEIGTISEDYVGKFRCFQIHPKNYPQYLSRLSAFKRFTIRRTASWPNPPLQVPLRDLERPGVEILQQLAQRYARELDYYRISLQVAPEE
jgi:hypothetical protein